MVSKLNVIVVNYRTPGLSIRCVRSIIDRSISAAEDIIVVDNLSRDNSVEHMREEMPPAVRIVESRRNAGFGAGVNLGFEHSDADYLLILNPDTYFEFDSVAGVLDYMDTHRDVGLCGLDLVNPDRSRQYSARRFYSVLDVGARRVRKLGALMKKRVDRHLMRDQWAKEKPFDAEWVMGTGFIIRSDIYRKLNGMDESYFLYMEDVDLCARTWQAGARVVCYPGAQLVHDHQRSSAAGPLTFAGRTHIRSLLKFGNRFTLPLIRSPGLKKIIKS